MRKTALLIASMALGVLLASGVGWAATIRCPTEEDGRTCYGTNEDDVIYGTRKTDIIDGRGGNDKLYGRQKNDKLIGNAGHNDLYGGTGADELRGASGKDYINGGKGSDSLFGRIGDDTLLGGPGLDSFEGVPETTYGNDTVIAGPASQTNEKREFASGGYGDDIVRGSGGSDEIQDFDGSNRLFGNGGNDHFSSFDFPKPSVPQEDYVSCGEGYDVAFVDETDEVTDDCEEVHVVD